MSGTTINIHQPFGLSQAEVALQQKKYGKNILQYERQHRIYRLLFDVFREPMFILLIISCALYFLLGEVSEGIMMAIAMVIVAAISIYQDVKSSNAIEALRQYAEPKVKVIRDGRGQVISNEDLVPGDIILLQEGMKIPADAIVIQSNDFTVNESLITGESVPVAKTSIDTLNFLYQGCTVESGKCFAKVEAIGNMTMLGRIGKAVSGYSYPKTILQVQVNKFVRRLALFGLLGFLVILIVNYYHYREFATSLLFALTLAMSALPEEIPVAFSSFMALGAYRMSKLGIISRQPQIIENLGSVTVLCLDKTGTITENKMQLKNIYDFENDSLIDIENKSPASDHLLLFASLASESNPFDSMERAIWNAYQTHVTNKTYDKYKMIHEYPLGGHPPMMTHVYRRDGDHGAVVAAKGAAERILRVCNLGAETIRKVMGHAIDFASNGYRVLGVAAAVHRPSNFPTLQDEFNWNFLGLIALYDPPKKNVKEVLKKITNAGISVKLLTGDFSETALNISRQVGISTEMTPINGEQVMGMSDEELKTVVQGASVFTRMFPEAKLKVINALKANKEIVAMSGDGINDAPALKAADIGVAMGGKGTETARRASDLIITDDDLEKMAIAISEGRKTSNNLLKGIRYIISIHIPIILTASLPLLFGWTYPNIFTPIHVIFLELIMGPTCSIFFESEPVERDLMLLPPRNRAQGLFTWKELLIAIIQGLTITTGVLILYHAFMSGHHSIEKTRTIVFTTMILSNLFLTFVSRSFTRTLYYTIRYKNRLAPWIIIISSIFLVSLQFITPIRHLFQMTPLTLNEFLICFVVAFATVMWFEVYKLSLWTSNR
ncbi:MAG TPA: cation-translocating P-type ATPase [Chitinophagaceae bacterium]|nr:cation-translocating P-type ATPase [Chitinophagaceae bacterium]